MKVKNRITELVQKNEIKNLKNAHFRICFKFSKRWTHFLQSIEMDIL